MTELYIVDDAFEKKDFSINSLDKGDYEYCTFLNCDFSNSDLSEVRFIDCEFVDCNLCSANLKKSALQGVKFKNCKMLGLHFDKCNPFGFTVMFEDCTLNHSSFYKTKIRNTVFKNSKLIEVDFTQCDLTETVFNNCNLDRATFDNTIIEHANFCTSYNYSINPEINQIKKAKFSKQEELFERYKEDLGNDYSLNDILEVGYPIIEAKIDIIASGNLTRVIPYEQGK